MDKGNIHNGQNGVNQSFEEAYVKYCMDQCASNHSGDSLVNRIDATYTAPWCCKLSSREQHIYTEALQH